MQICDLFHEKINIHHTGATSKWNLILTRPRVRVRNMNAISIKSSIYFQNPSLLWARQLFQKTSSPRSCSRPLVSHLNYRHNQMGYFSYATRKMQYPLHSLPTIPVCVCVKFIYFQFPLLWVKWGQSRTHFHAWPNQMASALIKGHNYVRSGMCKDPRTKQTHMLCARQDAIGGWNAVEDEARTSMKMHWTAYANANQKVVASGEQPPLEGFKHICHRISACLLFGAAYSLQKSLQKYTVCSTF